MFGGNHGRCASRRDECVFGYCRTFDLKCFVVVDP